MNFWEALPILQNGIIATIIIAFMCSYLGVFVVLKRMVFMTVALSQVSSLGIAIAIPIQTWIWGNIFMISSSNPSTFIDVFPTIIAMFFSCLAAFIMAHQYSEKKITRECLLGIGYVISAALVMLIIDLTDSSMHDINDLFFGNTVFVPTIYLLVLTAVTLIVFLINILLYKEFVFISFDPETAKALGLNTIMFSHLLFYSLALMISVSISTIGLLPVFSFMVIPAVAALMLEKTLKQTFIFAVLFGVTSAMLGYYLSFQFALPTGPTIIVMTLLSFIPGFILRSTFMSRLPEH